ncbi:MAG TPA: effector binding domain-containing protein [Rummeliibacillus sp.]|nr:effector binding domain-containing protein [Rummeliibacillus sp.]
MNLKLINTIRTNNFNDKNVMKKIKNMWEEASIELSNFDGCIYGLYFDYETDYKGDYHLGVAIEDEVKGTINLNDNIKYEVFKVSTKLENGIFNTWMEIWDKEKEGHLKRAYTFDYEKYYPNGDIEIYIAVDDM